MRPNTARNPAALLGLLLSFLIATPLSAEDTRPMDRLITVSATGHASAEPDRARIATGVTVEAETARDALTANTKAMKAVVDGLKESGVDAKDIQTSNFNIEPRYTNPRDGTPAVIDGYRVSNQVEILVRDLGALGELLDKIVTLGANRMHSLTFVVSEEETLKDSARKEAVANARRRADLLAAAAGAELGDVVTILEDVQYGGPPRPMLGRAATMEAAPPPIEAGTATLEARVTVTWRLK